VSGGGTVALPATTTPQFVPGPGARELAQSPLGGGASWSVLSDGVGCFWTQIRTSGSTDTGQRCADGPMDPKHLPLTFQWSADSPVGVVFVVAPGETRELRVRSRTHSGRWALSKITRPVFRPQHGYVVFVVAVPPRTTSATAATTKPS
jgi:hypothetical protein